MPIDMLRLSAGQVTLRDRRTEHSWTVEVGTFQLAETPVTQQAYEQVTGRRPGVARGDRLPVETVSWWDTVRFCNALSEAEGLAAAYEIDVPAERVNWDRSATATGSRVEAEWEYACRAGTTGPRYGPLDDIGWYRDNSGGRIHEVAPVDWWSPEAFARPRSGTCRCSCRSGTRPATGAR